MAASSSSQLVGVVVVVVVVVIVVFDVGVVVQRLIHIYYLFHSILINIYFVIVEK